MKRKKFIKMLLSRRVPRNQAEALAEIVQQLGVGYSKALGDFLSLAWMRTHNALYDTEVWQTSAANCWVEVLANE